MKLRNALSGGSAPSAASADRYPPLTYRVITLPVSLAARLNQEEL